jgi:hypothetical protein
MADRLSDLIAQANSEKFLVNGLAQLNQPDGVTWAASLFRRSSQKRYSYSYHHGFGDTAEEALRAALKAGRERYAVHEFPADYGGGEDLPVEDVAEEVMPETKARPKREKLTQLDLLDDLPAKPKRRASADDLLS